MMSSSGPGSNNPAPPPYPGFSPGHPHSSPSTSSSVASPSFPLPVGPSKATPPHLGSATPSSQAPSYSDAEEKQRVRFQIELEFVQCLGNPNYLHFLAQRGYFKEPKFINYLKYLLYWKEPEYVKFLKYPVCLHFLELLQHESFRKEAVNGQCAKFLDDQTILHWQSYTRKRQKLIESKMEATNATANPANSQAQNAATAAAAANPNANAPVPTSVKKEVM